MFVDVTSWPNETLAELQESWLLFFRVRDSDITQLADDRHIKWDNTPWAYEERRQRGLCTLHLRIEA